MNSTVDINELEGKRKHLEGITRGYFSKWYRRFLRWTLRKLTAKADELRTNTDYGLSACGCFVDGIHNTLCFWHELDAYLR
jgi:hypothetical protein